MYLPHQSLVCQKYTSTSPYHPHLLPNFISPPPPNPTSPHLLPVGNINFDLSEQDVIEYFTQVGPVKSARIVTDRETGKPRGFGFVEFYDIPTAESAVRNLNGSDMGGRTIRVTFAEDAPGSTSHQQRPGSTAAPGGHHPSSIGGGGRDLTSHKNRMIVGNDLAYHSHRGVASLLGAAAASSQDSAAADALLDATTTMLARKTRSEIYNYLADMKEYATTNPTEARQLLTANPQLTKALFQMEVIVGMVRNPLGNVAPKGAAPGGGGGGGGLGRPSSSMHKYEQQQGNGSQQGVSGGGGGGGGGGPVDPRRGGAVPPRPMVSVAVQQQQQREKASSLMPGMSPEQQEALLQQVMSLTAEQIELLPAEQKAQVVALQNLQRGGE